MAKIFMETVLSLYSIVEKIFNGQMFQSVVNVIKGLGMIMVAMVEAFLKILKMIVK
ncbi:MAG: hypothetical protein WC483_05045 [Candidatus Paceibacterota bacterium]